MNEGDIFELLERVRSGGLSVEAATALFRVGQREPAAPQPHAKDAAFEAPNAELADLGFARIDLERAARQGMPEIVFGENKGHEQIVSILDALTGAGQLGFVTRVTAEKAAQVQSARPDVRYNVQARTLAIGTEPTADLEAVVAVVTAGTTDIPVAEEAVETLRVGGLGSDRIYDVGVAGIHRLFREIERIRRARAVIVCAGMEGALPSVLGGLVKGPVIAVPTSIGYGAALSGLTALLGMLTSCAAGVTVVNIDNGFGAAMAVLRILGVQGDP